MGSGRLSGQAYADHQQQKDQGFYLFVSHIS
jgi:hypothetical protein